MDFDNIVVANICYDEFYKILRQINSLKQTRKMKNIKFLLGAVIAVIMPSVLMAQTAGYTLNGKVGQLSAPARAKRFSMPIVLEAG